MNKALTYFTAIAATLFVGLNTAMAATKNGADPTDFITRYEPSYEHQKLENGSEVDLVVLRADLALKRNLSIRIDLPYVDFDPSALPTAAGFQKESGMGDVITQIIYKPYSDAKKAVIVGLRVDWDTASEGELGQGGTTVAPLAAVAFYPNRKWLIVPLFQWYIGKDLDNDPLPGKRDRSALSVRPLVIWQPMKRSVSWILIDPEWIIDFEDDDKTTFRLGIEYGKMVSKTKAIFIKPTFGADDSGLDWSIKIGFRHMFPGKYFVR